MRLQFAFLHLV